MPFKPHHMLTVRAANLLCDQCSEHLKSLGLQREHSPDFNSALRRITQLPKISIVIFEVARFDDACCLALERVVKIQAMLLVIIVTYDACELAKLKAFDEGAADYLIAPITPRELGLRIRNMLRRL